MALKMLSPIIGRAASTGSLFLLSCCGRPVPGSIGDFSQMMVPQIPAPHLLTCILASPASVSQTPVGSALDSADAGAAASAIVAASIRIGKRDISTSFASGQNDEEVWLRTRKPVGLRGRTQPVCLNLSDCRAPGL